MQRKTAAEGRSNKDVADRSPLSESIKGRVKYVIAKKLGLDLEDVKPESSLIDDLGADPLDFIYILMALEEEFNIDIADEDAEKFETVQDVYDYVNSAAQ